jgi:hypothetical protein
MFTFRQIRWKKLPKKMNALRGEKSMIVFCGIQLSNSEEVNLNSRTCCVENWAVFAEMLIIQGPRMYE